MKLEHLGEKMVIFKGFFCKIFKWQILLFCPWQKQNYRICHSDQAFNACQIEISIEPVSIAKGCHFIYQSCFYSLKGEERGEVISVEEESSVQIHVVESILSKEIKLLKTMTFVIALFSENGVKMIIWCLHK